MGRVSRRGLIAGVIVAAGLVASTSHVQRYRHRAYLHEALYLPSGKFVEQLSLGYREIVADFIWFSAVQYYGEYRMDDHDLRYFESLMDIITTLDPHFVFAYVFAALVVSEDLGAFDRGMDILKAGMARNPTNWELPFEIGFLNFVNRVDYNVAARYFDLSSRLPGAPEHTQRFAAYVYSTIGNPSASIGVWEEYRDATENPLLKEMAERYIQKLQQEQAQRGESQLN